MGTTVSVVLASRQELCHEEPALSCNGDAHWDAHLRKRRGKLNGGNRDSSPGIEQRFQFRELGLERRGQ
jgi:hypothetical protein